MEEDSDDDDDYEGDEGEDVNMMANYNNGGGVGGDGGGEGGGGAEGGDGFIAAAHDLQQSSFACLHRSFFTISAHDPCRFWVALLTILSGASAHDGGGGGDGD